PGHLVVKGPTPEYLHTPISMEELVYARPGGKPQFPDGFAFVDYEVGAGPQHLSLRLRRGVTVPSRFEGADGGPVAAAVVLCPAYITQGQQYGGARLYVRNGRLEVPGCAPDKGTTVFVLDPRKRQGALAELRGRPGKPEPVVRLSPCGSVTVRFLD